MRAQIGINSGENKEYITWTHPFLHEILDVIPKEVKSLIDVGCGKGIIGALMRIYRNSSRLVGIDIRPDYLDFCKKFNFYDEVYQVDLRKLPLPFKDKEFEVATCIEVIEHLTKTEGEVLLNELERIAGNIVITTPSYWHPNIVSENPFRWHRSLWKVSDFKKKGYLVKGTGNLKILNLPLHLRIFTSKLPNLFEFVMAVKSVRE